MSATGNTEPAASSNSLSSTDVAPSTAAAEQIEKDVKPRRPKKKQACRFFATKKGRNNWRAYTMTLVKREDVR